MGWVGPRADGRSAQRLITGTDVDAHQVQFRHRLVVVVCKSSSVSRCWTMRCLTGLPSRSSSINWNANRLRRWYHISASLESRSDVDRTWRAGGVASGREKARKARKGDQDFLGPLVLGPGLPKFQLVSPRALGLGAFGRWSLSSGTQDGYWNRELPPERGPSLVLPGCDGLGQHGLWATSADDPGR